MALYVTKKPNINELELFLQGAIIGGQKLEFSNTEYGLWRLVGETATFATPAGSVTFVVGADSAGFLTFAEIKAQIEAALGVVVSLYDQRIVIKATPAGSISIGSAAKEPARGILGFDGKAGGYVSNVVYNGPAGALPRLVSVIPSPGQESLVVVTEV